MVRSNALVAGVLLGGAGVGAMSNIALAGITANQVVDYNAGTVVNSYWGAPYTDPSAALGTPDLTQNVAGSAGPPQIFADNSAITPFNAQFNPQNVVAIQGAGGQITLKLSSPVVIGAGAALGIHAAVGFEDASYPNGQNSDPALAYTDPRMADLQVSGDGMNWVDLGDQAFENPTNIYTDATDPTGTTPGTVVANFFQPFNGSLSSFNGKDFPGTLAVLNGSAGGDWFDLSKLALSDVDYVRLTTIGGEKMFVDSVVADSSTGAPPPPPPPPSSVPLPAAAVMALSALPLARLARRSVVRK
jgi:hypothetical protein